MVRYRLIRVAGTLPLLANIGAASPGAVVRQAQPDAALIEKGDLGIATYAMLFVIVALLIDRWMDRRASRAMTGDFVAATDKLASAVDRMTEQNSARSTAELIHNARMESVITRVEAYLHRMDGNVG